MPYVSIVLPVYRTAASLPELYRRLRQTLKEKGISYEIIFVDDGSPDGAWKVISELAAHDPRVKGVRLSRNFGQHPATAAGLDRVSGDRVVIMDSDLQDRPEDVPLLLRELHGDVDIVYSTKQQCPAGALVRLTSWLFHRVFSSITQAAVQENIGTFRAFSRRFLDALKTFPERNVVFGPLMFYVGFRHGIVQLPRDVRLHGQSSYTFRKRLALALDCLVTYTDLPHRLLMHAGGLVMAFSVVLATIIVGRYVTVGTAAPPGLTLVAMLTIFSLGTTMFGLGIIGTYVFRVFQEVLRRPRYVLADTCNLETGFQKEVA